MRENAYLLLGIVQSHAPSGTAQQAVTKLYNGTPPEEREKALACALTDGLLYGNWPWTVLEGLQK